MPRARSILIALLVVLLVGSFAAWRLAQADTFWRWAGGKMVAAAQEQLNGVLSVEKIRGNPLTGLFFEGVNVASPEGEILRLQSLEVQISLWSVVQLKPVVKKLALTKPRLNLTRDESGVWNISRLWAAPDKPAERGAALPFRALDFRRILVTDGEITLIQNGTQTRYHNLNADLALTLENPFSPEQSLRIPQAKAAVTTPVGRFALAASLDFGENRLDLRTLTLERDQERLLSLGGQANLAAKPGEVRFNGEVGPIPGEIISRFWAQWPGAWEVRGAVQVQGSLAQVEMNLEGAIHQTPYRLNGTLADQGGKWRYDATLDLEGLKPEMLATLGKPWAEKSRELAPLSLRLRVTGVGLAWPPERFASTLESEPFTYGRARIERFLITAAGSHQEQDIDANLQGNFGSASLRGRGSFLAAPAGEVKFQARALRPDLLGLAAPRGTRLDANLSAMMSLPDIQRLDGLKVTGEVEAAGQVGEYPLRELKGRLTWQKSDLNIPRLRVHLGNLAADLQGSLKGEQLNFTLAGRSTPGGDWPIPAGVGGRLTWEGSLRGTVSDPAVAVQAQGRALAYENFRLQSFSLTARARGWPPSSGSFDLQGRDLSTPAGMFAQTSFTGETAGERWNFRFNAASPPSPQVEMAGSADLRSRPLEVTLDRCRFQVQKVAGQNRTPIRLRMLPGFELEPATLAINQGSLTLEGRLDGTAVTGRLMAQDLPLELSGIKDLGGKLHARMSLEGSAASPGIQGEIRVEPGQWRRLRFAAITTALQYQDAGVSLNGTLAESTSGARVQWDGRLPLMLSLSPWRFMLPNEDLRFRLTGEGVNLSVVTEFTPELEEAQAPIEVAAEMGGRWSKPLVSGQVKWGAGFVRARQSGARFALKPGVMHLQGDRLNLPQLTLESDGVAMVRADVALAGFRPAEVKGRAQFTNFQVLDRLRSHTYVNGEVAIDGPWEALAVTGRLTIPEASLTPQLLKWGDGEIHPDIVLVREKKQVKKPEIEPVEPDFLKNMRVAVTVDGRNNIWVRDRNADVELFLAVGVNKRPGENLVVGGVIRSLRGTIGIQGREFRLVKGIVDLPPTPALEPYIEARAVHETWDVTIMVDVTGTPDNPRIELSSDPALPKAEILSYLVFGRPSEALSREEFNASKLAGGVLGGLTAQKIRDILGPDFPLLGDVALKTGDTLGIVKPLTKGVTLTLSEETTPEGKRGGFQAQLQYRVNRNVTVEAQTGANPGADVFFNYDF